MVAALEENLGMLPAIKAFTREAHESTRFRQHNDRLMRVAHRQYLIQSILGPAAQLVAGLGLLLLLYFSTTQLHQGSLESADIVSIVLYSLLLTRPMSGLADTYGSIQTTRGAAQRLIEALAKQPEPSDTNERLLPPPQGNIVFDQVSFSYPGREQPILHGVTLEVMPGETIALTGKNGSGKSTLMHLLMRFADPDQGRILIDGTDIRSVSITSLRKQIGLVAQHTLLLNGTIRDNIAYADPGADDTTIEAAARSALAHEFISQLPQAYDTMIGDQGIRLSGGQRQRLALARALLKDPPILIFDEATAMFDPEGEVSFLETCRPTLDQRTVILITHRPASLTVADRRLDVASLFS